MNIKISHILAFGFARGRGCKDVPLKKVSLTYISETMEAYEPTLTLNTIEW
jgi:hypothetical protein